MSETLSYQEEELEKPRVYDNPIEYFQAFHSSSDYQHAIALRINEVHKRNPKATNAAIESAFEDVEIFKQLLFDYFKTHKLNYNPGQYNQKTKAALQEYWNSVMSYQETLGQSPSPAYLQAAEHSRVMKHLRAAEEMVKDGKAPDARVGRILVHFLSVSEGIDNFDPERDARRLEVLKGYEHVS